MYTTPPKLSNIHILLADGDLYMSSILYHMLHTMGFSNVTRVSSGHKALDLIESRPIDIVITEWTMEGKDGLDLVRFLRDLQRSPNFTMPVIIMTGRAERLNVQQARDCGVTGFLVKPVTTAMLFDRIRRVFDTPRDFVIDHSYVGPDRRHVKPVNASGEAQDKRVAKPLVVSKASMATNNNRRPIIISKNFDLRGKAHLSDSLTTVITPELLTQAEAVIASYRSESSQWIFDDVQTLERAIGFMQSSVAGANQQAQQAALSIKSRAGTFGFDMAANVAYALYVFLYHDCKAHSSAHMLIARKHVDVIKVLLAGQKMGTSREMEEELVEELLKMTTKLKESAKPADAAEAMAAG